MPKKRRQKASLVVKGLTLRKSYKLDHCQADVYNAEVVANYFNLLENVLKEVNAARQLYNCGHSLDMYKGKSHNPQKHKHAYFQAQGMSVHVTMHRGSSVAGIPWLFFRNHFLEVPIH